MSPDGSTFAAIIRPQQLGGPWAIRLFNLRDGSERTVETGGFSFDFAQGVSFDPSGRFIAAGTRVGATIADRALGIFDATTLELLREIPSQRRIDQNYEFAPDGNTLLVAAFQSAEGFSVQLWNPMTAELISRTRVTTGTASSTAGFNTAGNVIAMSLEPGRATLLGLPDFVSLEPPFPMLSPDPIRAFFGAGEKTLYTWPISNVIEQWDLSGRGPATVYSYLPGEGRAAVAPDGRWFVKQAADGSWSRWSLPGLQLLNRSAGTPGPPGYLYGGRPAPVAVSGDSRLFATVHADCQRAQQRACSASVIVWDAESGKPIGDPIRVPNTTTIEPGVLLAFDPTRPLLAVTLPQHRVQLWQVDSTGLTKKTEFAVLDPDAPRLWSVGLRFAPRPGGPPLLWVTDAANGEQLWDITASPPAAMVKSSGSFFTAQGTTPTGAIVLGFANGDVRFFEPNELAKTDPKPSVTFQDAVPASLGSFSSYFSFSADGRRMAVVRDAAINSLTGGSPFGAGQVEVWDVEKGEKIGSAFASSGSATAAWMSADGSKVTVVSDQAVVVWDLNSKLWAEKVCFAAGRNLTEAEWTKYFPGRDYAVTCDQWPAKPKT